VAGLALAGPGPGAAASPAPLRSRPPRPALPQRGLPAPGRSPPEPAWPPEYGGHTSRSGQEPAQQTSAPHSRPRGRRTAAQSGGSPPAARPPPRRPGAADSGCAPGKRWSRTTGSTLSPQPPGTRSPRHQPAAPPARRPRRLSAVTGHQDRQRCTRHILTDHIGRQPSLTQSEPEPPTGRPTLTPTSAAAPSKRRGHAS
jgi:hypothetical protein